MKEYNEYDEDTKLGEKMRSSVVGGITFVGLLTILSISTCNHVVSKMQSSATPKTEQPENKELIRNGETN